MINNINNTEELNKESLEEENTERCNGIFYYDYLLSHPLQIIDSSCVVCYREQLKELRAHSFYIKELKIMFLDYSIEDADILLLGEYLNSDAGKEVKNLYLRESRLTNVQANKLIEILMSSSCAIEKLSFCDNDLNNDLSFLCNIKYFHNSLTHLDLSVNNLSQSIEYVIEILNNCPLLEQLYLSICCLTDADIKKLYVSLQCHPRLAQICLNNNQHITDASFEYFKEIIQYNSRLTYIDLSGIEFSSNSINELNILAKQMKLQLIINKTQSSLSNSLTKCVIS